MSLGRSTSLSPLLALSADRRLAFRELGLAIGLHALEQVESLLEGDEELADTTEKQLHEYQRLAEQIEAYWAAPDVRRCGAWTQHDDINTVMLATSLAPEGYLHLAEAAAQSKNPTEY